MLKNNIPIYQACANVVSLIKSNQSFRLSNQTLHHLFVHNKDTHPHPMLFILKRLYRNNLSELNDEFYAKQLRSWFNSMKPSQLKNVKRSLVHKLITYSLEKKFIACASVIEDVFLIPEKRISPDSFSQTSSLTDTSVFAETTSEESTEISSSINPTIDEFSDQLKINGICPNVFLNNFLKDFRRTNLSTDAYKKKIRILPHCLFYHSMSIEDRETNFKQTWPILHLLARVTNSEARTQKLLAICDYLGVNNVIQILQQYNEYCDTTGLKLIHPSQRYLFNQAINQSQQQIK
ncbi:MAG: hypothetical protein VX835_04085 [Pseudomonadota bacterium]|nr:hypothetical protein [Pseudomonadota bacterium]